MFGKDATPKSVRDEHFVEKFLGEVVEKPYREFLDRLISSIDRAKNNSWCLKNCMCLSEEDKKGFSYYLVIQYLRGKYLPNTFEEFCEKVVGTKISNTTSKVAQTTSLMNSKIINMMRGIILKHKWVIYINNTGFNFYTSDCPFINQVHKFKDGIPYTQFDAPGIEIVFPITKYAILVIYGEKAYEIMQLRYGKNIYSDEMKPEDRRFREIKNIRQVEYYNILQIAYSINEIYLSDNNKEFIEQVLGKHPEYLTKEYITVLDNKD